MLTTFKNATLLGIIFRYSEAVLVDFYVFTWLGHRRSAMSKNLVSCFLNPITCSWVCQTQSAIFLTITLLCVTPGSCQSQYSPKILRANLWSSHFSSLVLQWVTTDPRFWIFLLRAPVVSQTQTPGIENLWSHPISASCGLSDPVF